MTVPFPRRLEIADEPAAEDIEAVSRRLEDFNEQHWPGHQPWRSLGVFLRDETGNIQAGLVGATYGGWLHVMQLWVCDGLRGRGIGRRILGAAEQHAMERGCHSVWLDTFSFQAPEFYRRLGYELFGELDWSAEHRRLLFRKRLSPRGPGPG